MGCLKRYSKTVDGTIPVQALLYPDEDLLSSQEGVGIYDGTLKSPSHQNGTVHITTHRLFYIDLAHPRRNSFCLDLSHVSRTDYYAGLFTSSAKATLWLHPLSTQPRTNRTAEQLSPALINSAIAEIWVCEVCSFKNSTAGLSPEVAKVCSLCGVPRSLSSATSSAPTPTPSAPIATKSVSLPSSYHHLSSSLPSSSADLLEVGSASLTPAETTPATGELGPNGEIPCPACTFLNHPSLPACEICGTALPRRQKSSTKAKSAPSSRPISPAVDSDEDEDFEAGSDEMKRMIKISFRKGGDKNFYAVVKRSLLGRGWEIKGVSKSTLASPGPTSSAATSGINALLQNVNLNAATSQSNMENALQDLEALMVKAKDMVRLAEDLNERLTAATSASAAPMLSSSPSLTSQNVVEPEEATFIRSSLSQLGLQMTNAPVTLDMIRDERRWIEELAKELGGVLQGQTDDNIGMMRQRGIIALDEAWGGWNRARGVALIPPTTFLQVLPQLPSWTSPPINMRIFTSSGLSVLHTPPYTKAAFASRMVGLINLTGPITTVKVAQDEQLPVGLVQEMVQEVEEAGEVCRDEGGSGINVFDTNGWDSKGGNEVMWWVNIFKEYVWDGQADL
ncbi:EAP30/Vps36 family-domain-containing protein [Abortiporus biennis]|nr:EAP30/Vps36 family-domain-containing protein [Abortiporus biennis]